MVEEKRNITQVMTTFELETAVLNLQHDFNKLRKDWEEAESRLMSKLMEIKQNNTKTEGKLGGYTVKELLALKQIGINPKDLLGLNTVKMDDTKT